MKLTLHVLEEQRVYILFTRILPILDTQYTKYFKYSNYNLRILNI